MTTQPQPDALRLAGALLEPVVLDKHAMQAAAELRRLHAECEALRVERDALRAELAEQAAEQARPDIIERLTYHALERDDLTLDDCLAYLAEGWTRVRGRTERQMVLQLTALLAGAPAAEQAEPVAWALTKQLEKRETTTNGYLWFSDPQNSSWEPLYRKAPAPARQEWQPIETAPKTGAKIIVRYVNRNNKPRTVMARWLTDEQAEETDADGVGLKGGWYECIDNWDDYTEVAIHEGEPSLWQPLPAAPIPAAPAEGGA